MRSASAVPVPGRRRHQPGGAGIESQAPRSCQGSVAISASALRTVSSHHFTLHSAAAAAGCSPGLRSPQHPRGSLPAGTGALPAALRVTWAAPVSAGRGRAPPPSRLPGRGPGRGQPPGRAGAGAGAAPARGGGSAGYRLLSLPAHPPERWPRHRLEPQPLPFAPALPLSLPRPHLSSKTAGAATAPLHSLRRQRRSGAGTARGGSGPPAMAGVRARR